MIVLITIAIIVLIVGEIIVLLYTLRLSLPLQESSVMNEDLDRQCARVIQRCEVQD